MNGRTIKKAVKKTFKVIDKLNWGKAAGNASSVAGALGGAIALARAAKRKNSFFRSKKDRIMQPVRVGAASLALLAGSLQLLNNNMQRKNRKMFQRRSNARRYFRLSGF